jgi:hypothetical protein
MMMKISEAVVGNKIGRLTIENISGTRNIHGKLIANCICDCGNKITATINNIGNKTNSCGCLKAEKIIIRCGKDIKHNVSSKVLCDSLQKTRESDLTINDISSLIFENCFYCGKSPKEVGILAKQKNISKKEINRIGIDRIDNSIGYYKNNVAPCCLSCNFIKSDCSIEYILKYFSIISFNARKLIDSFPMIESNNYCVIIEHIDKCRCYSGDFKTTLEDRIVKIVKNAIIHWGRPIFVNNDFIKNVIYSSKCFYCERHIKDVGLLNKRNGYSSDLCSIRRLGMDRINSQLGYIDGNIVPCCVNCNSLKRDFDISTFYHTTDAIHKRISELDMQNKNNYRSGNSPPASLRSGYATRLVISLPKRS